MAATEIVTEIAVRIPREPCGGAYAKFERRAGDFAVASVGVQIELDDTDCLRSVSISVGACGPLPTRAQEAENVLSGVHPTADVLESAEHLVREHAQPFEDTRGSVDYKRHLAGVLFRRAFAAALDRAHGKDVRTITL